MSIARGGRLAAADQAMLELNQSVTVDHRLWREDLDGSKAHVGGLQRAGILTDAEAGELIGGLDRIAEEIETGQFVWDPIKEDVHMNIEARLVELVGPVGGKLHTGRSRNDQVATDLRLYARRRGGEVAHAVAELASVLIDRAEEQLEVLMPAYTHLQRGQPSRLSHHLMAWQEMLWRDFGRIHDALARMNECPLGAGAAAGTGFALDRAQVADELGFDRATANSLDATASRDFLMELVSALAILGVHLSRIGEELVLWSSQEFGFIELADGFTTSSSMMPQKKNPDVAELVRGKAALLVGASVSLMVLEKSLCFGYGRDLQEDKRPLLDSCDNAKVSLAALTGALATVRFRGEKMEAALTRGHLVATDVADLLVTQGVPFREAHHIVGGLVRAAEASGVELSALPAATWVEAHPALTGEALIAVLDPRQAVERRALFGGPARPRVEQAIARARSRWDAALA